MNELAADNARPVFTIGHSTRSLEDFINLLKDHGVTRIVDVRTIPHSRHNPQFNRDTLAVGLDAASIGYTHIAGLGGLRHARSDSVNTGWRNLSFRGFADYMESEEFSRSLDQLIDLTRNDTIAVMCAEAVPWRCHRSLIADALLVRGHAVEDIIGPTSTKRHSLTSWATVHGIKISYAPVSPEPNRVDEVMSPAFALTKGKRHALTTAGKRVGRKALSPKNKRTLE